MRLRLCIIDCTTSSLNQQFPGVMNEIQKKEASKDTEASTL